MLTNINCFKILNNVIYSSFLTLFSKLRLSGSFHVIDICCQSMPVNLTHKIYTLKIQNLLKIWYLNMVLHRLMPLTQQVICSLMGSVIFFGQWFPIISLLDRSRLNFMINTRWFLRIWFIYIRLSSVWHFDYYIIERNISISMNLNCLFIFYLFSSSSCISAFYSGVLL